MVLTVLAGIVGYLVYTIIKLRDTDYSFLANRMAKRSRDSFEVLKPCPLCSTMLRRGERLHTVVYSGGRAQTSAEEAVSTSSVEDVSQEPKQPERTSQDDTLAYMYGCPYCYPANDQYPRYCPVCDRKLGEQDYVIARMFTRKPRNHVHVLGCTLCRGPASRTRR
ncbi:MAG: hypothetical protein ACQETQ_02140 [Spirochaetota bacterium]